MAPHPPGTPSPPGIDAHGNGSCYITLANKQYSGTADDLIHRKENSTIIPRRPITLFGNDKMTQNSYFDLLIITVSV